MNRKISRTAIGAGTAALISVAASTAMAQAPGFGCPTGEAKTTTCVNGGGSTLAQNVYMETSPAGIFDSVAALSGGKIGISYVGSGSGAGQLALFDNDPSQYSSSIAVDAYTVHFAASDAYVSGSSGLGSIVGPGKSLPGSGGPFIQIPMFATPITIPVVNSKVTADGKGTLHGPGTVVLTDADLCGIFSGVMTNWNETSAKHSLAAGKINVYWRNDNGGSGTTFLLTQHLAAVCVGANAPENGVKFMALTKFALEFQGIDGVTISTPATGVTWTIPTSTHGYFANFVGATGSGGVATTMAADTTGSAIGYLSPDYTSIAQTPKTGFGTLKVASIHNATNHNDYAPDVASVRAAIQDPGPTATNLKPPALTAANAANAATQTNWVPQIPNPASGYPVVGYTNLMIAQCYKSGTVANSIIRMVQTDLSPVGAALLVKNGFEPTTLTLPGGAIGFGDAVLDAFVHNVGSLNLNINNPAVCKSKTNPGGFAGR